MVKKWSVIFNYRVGFSLGKQNDKEQGWRVFNWGLKQEENKANKIKKKIRAPKKVVEK